MGFDENECAICYLLGHGNNTVWVNYFDPDYDTKTQDQVKPYFICFPCLNTFRPIDDWKRLRYELHDCDHQVCDMCVTKHTNNIYCIDRRRCKRCYLCDQCISIYVTKNDFFDFDE
jgi:hypothetical protein